MKGVIFSYRLKAIWVKFIKNTIIWNEPKNLKYLDWSHAKETKTKNLLEIFFNLFFPVTINSIKRKINHEGQDTP